MTYWYIVYVNNRIYCYFIYVNKNIVFIRLGTVDINKIKLTHLSCDNVNKHNNYTYEQSYLHFKHTHAQLSQNHTIIYIIIYTIYIHIYIYICTCIYVILYIIIYILHYKSYNLPHIKQKYKYDV